MLYLALMADCFHSLHLHHDQRLQQQVMIGFFTFATDSNKSQTAKFGDCAFRLNSKLDERSD